MKKKINLICDFDNESGGGHLLRSLEFMNFFKKKKFKIDLYFFTKFKKKKININKGFKIITNDSLKIKDMYAISIIDSYYISKKNEKKIFDKNKRVIIIDDKLDRIRYGSVILNPSIIKRKFNLKQSFNKVVISGKKFLIIPQNIQKIKKKIKKDKSRFQNILINFGYSANILLKKFLSNYNFNEDLKYYVVVNKKYNGSKCINFIKKKFKYIQIIQDNSQYQRILPKIDFTIGCSGLSEIERRYLGQNSLLFSVSNDQAINGKYFSKLYGNYLGELNKKNIERLNSLSLKKFDRKKYKIKIDHKGIERIYKIYNSLEFK